MAGDSILIHSDLPYLLMLSFLMLPLLPLLLLLLLLMMMMTMMMTINGLTLFT